MIWKYFYSSRSSSDHGTLYQLRNKLNRTNVVKTPKNYVNVCYDFIDTVNAGLVIFAALATLNMDTVPDNSSDTHLHDIWGLPDTERKEALMNMCGQVYDKFISFSYNSAPTVTLGSDGIHEYTVQLICMGFFMGFTDSIR